jgi:hypothetical protein
LWSKLIFISFDLDVETERRSINFFVKVHKLIFLALKILTS